MKVLLTGASGFVGGAILHTLLNRGDEVVGAARNAASRETRPGLSWREADFMQDTSAENWKPLLEDIDAVINAAGIIRETSKVKFQQMHADAPKALFGAAQQQGISKVVQISAFGVKPDSPYEYNTSKFQADAFLQEHCAETSLILRPSLIFGREGEATKQFLGLVKLPVVPIVGDGSYEFRPVHVNDLAELVGRALHDEPQPTGIIAVGGAEVLTLRELFLALRAWHKGATSVDDPLFFDGPTMNMPIWMMKVAAAGGDATGLGPLSSDMLGMLTESQAPDITRMTETFGPPPVGLRQFICDNPL